MPAHNSQYDICSASFEFFHSFFNRADIFPWILLLFTPSDHKNWVTVHFSSVCPVNRVDVWKMSHSIIITQKAMESNYAV